MAKSPQLANFRVWVNNLIFAVDTEQNCLLVLLVLADPHCDRWSLPQTLVGNTESLEQAAYRTLAEKIRVKDLYLEQLYTFDNQPRSLAELTVSYFALVRHDQAELNAEGVNGIAWYAVNRIPPLAANHDQVLTYGCRRLRNKLEYSPIAFEVLPPTFTLGELFQFYRTVLGENFADYSNFRSRLLKLGFLVDTGTKVTRGAGRPASLYQFDPVRFARFKDQPMVFV
ncbi:MAG: NUDIX domain-containing protein [Pseudanabaenaceae cyanobacterium bins.68]|nr:NUDIX domain-containing protein [Pseudanabaenaceae cyanobacterium bins.68]